MQMQLEPEDCQLGDFIPENRGLLHDEIGPKLRAFVPPSIPRIWNLEGNEDTKILPIETPHILLFEYRVVRYRSQYGYTKIRAWVRIK